MNFKNFCMNSYQGQISHVVKCNNFKIEDMFVVESIVFKDPRGHFMEIKHENKFKGANYVKFVHTTSQNQKKEFLVCCTCRELPLGKACKSNKG